MIEDLSIDPDLDEDDHKISTPGKTGMNQMVGGKNLLSDILGIDDSLGNDYVEEKMDANGHTIRKEVHKGNGWTSVEISGDASMAGERGA